MDGILVVDKPQGLTSHDIVDLVRKKFAIKKVGHAGTLDPMATGVLVLLLGAHTRLSGKFMTDDKDYDATMLLGVRSDTGDAWGRLEDSGNRLEYTKQEIEDIFNRFYGEIEQCPPMYSSVKVNGRKLYELARKGVTIKVSARKVIIKRLEILKQELPNISFRLTCSKGTYVRQLCVDIGDALGCGAHLSCLRRTRSGRFGISEAVDMAELEKMNMLELENRLKRL